MGPNKSHKVLQQKMYTLQRNVFATTTTPPPNQNHSGTICGIALNTILHSGCISIHEFLWRSVDTPKVQICLTRTNSKINKQTFVNYVICKTYFTAQFFFTLDVIVHNHFVFAEILQLYIYSFIMLFMYKHK